ncbi:MAG TPA: TVP38/TMEM64 family protein [Pirellulaceae bacterium]|nr:TVP38/TMEM64 family protein [Pirellulaceae bacterium]
MPSDPAPAKAPARFGLAMRLILLAAIAAAAGLAWYFFRGELRIEALAAREMELREAVEAHPAAALAIAFAAYVAVTGLSLPGATAMSVLYGWLFGFWRGVVLVSFASTTGATLAFLMSRYLLGNWIQARFGERLAAINAAIEREGALYLLTLRLIPQVPFFVLNAVMGLTRMRVTTYWWVSQLGMLPATIVFVLAGANAPRLKTVAEKGLGSILDWRLMLPLALLAVLPLAIRWAVGRLGGKRQM